MQLISLQSAFPNESDDFVQCLQVAALHNRKKTSLTPCSKSLNSKMPSIIDITTTFYIQLNRHQAEQTRYRNLNMSLHAMSIVETLLLPLLASSDFSSADAAGAANCCCLLLVLLLLYCRSGTWVHGSGNIFLICRHEGEA